MYEKVIKRFLDVIMAFVLFIISLPILFVSAIAIKLDSKGKIIFKQKRVGKDGQVFYIYKLRTMSKDKNGVNKVTKVGKFLRITSIDELPQFINIIKGDMSFIGPRPWIESYSKYFTDEDKRRWEVLPGIKKTLDSLDTVGLDNTGVSYGEEKLKIININGIKVALLSYTYGTNAFSNHVYLDKNEKKVKVNLFQEQELSNTFVRNLYQGNNIVIKVLRKIFKFLGAFQLNKMVYERIESSKRQKKEIIKKINNCKKNGADCIIMCMHEGGQYNEKPIEKTKKTAKFLIKNGVNLVIGNHEHVVHNVEFVDDHFITYSLGNFIDTVGVLKDPFGKMSEYSILVNIYISKNDNKINYDKFTFTITKTVIDKRPNGNGVKVELLYDLIKKCNDKEERLKLLKDNQKIVGIVTKKIIDINNVKKEYELN